MKKTIFVTLCLSLVLCGSSQAMLRNAKKFVVEKSLGIIDQVYRRIWNISISRPSLKKLLNDSKFQDCRFARRFADFGEGKFSFREGWGPLVTLSDLSDEDNKMMKRGGYLYVDVWPEYVGNIYRMFEVYNHYPDQIPYGGVQVVFLADEFLRWDEEQVYEFLHECSVF